MKNSSKVLMVKVLANFDFNCFRKIKKKLKINSISKKS